MVFEAFVDETLLSDGRDEADDTDGLRRLSQWSTSLESPQPVAIFIDLTVNPVSGGKHTLNNLSDEVLTFENLSERGGISSPSITRKYYLIRTVVYRYPERLNTVSYCTHLRNGFSLHTSMTQNNNNMIITNNTTLYYGGFL